MEWIFALILLISCEAVVLDDFGGNGAVTASDANTINHINSNVPLLLSNTSFNTYHKITTELPKVAKDFVTVNINALPVSKLSSTSVAPQKVPLRHNASEEANNGAMSSSITVPSASSPFAQTSASVFFTNYHNQQNVLELVRNIDTRLRIIRNVEMRIATIQVS